jgi:signal transduction histidine kinase
LTLAEERERRRIAIEMHDRIGQSLAIAKIKLDGLRHSSSTANPCTILEDVCGMLDQAITDVRTLTFDLSSPILNELGLDAAVAAWLTEEIEQKHNIIVELQEDKKPKPLDSDIRAILFRNVRELLINVVKHSQAAKVKVSISSAGKLINISIDDNGVGFIPSEVTAKAVRKGGFGLFSIRERLEQLGGHLEIESTPGCGCKVTMTAPLKKLK